MSDFSISVVVPFYNRSECFERLINSIYNQSILPNIVYVIDNGSKISEIDTAYSIAIKYNDKLNIVFLSTLKKGNANFARNLGIYISEENYLAFLDSDDWWEENHLRNGIDLLSKNAKLGVYCGCISRNGNVSKVLNSHDVAMHCSPMDFFYAKNKGVAQSSSYIIKNYKNSPLFWDENLRRHQDYDFFCNVFYNGGWIFNPVVSVNFDRSNAVQGRNFHFKSMIRFCRKWQHIISGNSFKRYILSQLEICYIVSAPNKYKNYYKLLYIKNFGLDVNFFIKSSTAFFYFKKTIKRFLCI